MFGPTEQAIEEMTLELEKPQTWISIPLLNYMPIQELKDGNVVRFRGMIQDMQDPEIYFERYEVSNENGSKRIQDGKYRDSFYLHENETVNYESDCNVRGERRTLVVISVPGLNAWASNYEEKCNSGSMIRNVSTPGVNSTNAVLSTTCEDMDVEESELESITNKNVLQKEAGTKIGLDKRLESGDFLNSPIPERPGTMCMVKIYNSFDACPLNSVAEFVGIISVDSTTTSDNDPSSDLEYFKEFHTSTPYLVPCLHAVAFRQLYHLNPLLNSRLTMQLDKESTDLNMKSVQKDMRMLLTLCLFNDELAADYLLSHLISTVYNRSDCETVGKFSLNICNIPNEGNFTKKLYEFIELLLPASHYFALSLQNLNTTSFIPRKDYETNKLQSGVLQLAPHTHLVLDETQMHEGKLEENGVRGIQSLAYLIKHQRMKYNFQFYEIEYNTDIAVLVLSEGRSMLPSDFILPLDYDQEAKQHIAETLKAAHHYLQPERLDKFRRFLTIARTSKFTMNAEVSEMIQKDFVEMRKMYPSFNTDNLHALLVLSRLLAIAQGKKVLDEDSWIQAKAMEAKRKERILKLQLK